MPTGEVSFSVRVAIVEVTGEGSTVLVEFVGDIEVLLVPIASSNIS